MIFNHVHLVNLSALCLASPSLRSAVANPDAAEAAAK